MLTSLDIEIQDLKAELRASMTGSGEPGKGELPLTALAKKVLELTTTEAFQLGHNYIGCEHLLLGLIATEEGVASQVLRRMGVELRTTRRAVMTALSGFVHALENSPRAKVPIVDPAVEEILERATKEILERL